jgi:hypothetical protein
MRLGALVDMHTFAFVVPAPRGLDTSVGIGLARAGAPRELVDTLAMLLPGPAVHGASAPARATS